MEKTRVVVVDDSLTIRKWIVEVLNATPDLEVVADVADGREAIEVCRELRPDVITLDMVMPVMSGLAATEYIMAHFPTPILIVSASTNRNEVFKTCEALAAGAVDVLEKPQSHDEAWEQKLVSTVRLISRVKVITHLRAKLAPRAMQANPAMPQFDVAAIGASTGGPAAIVELLHKLPAGYPIPILLVLHLSPAFADAFVDWLDGQTSHRVSWATEGAPLSTLRGGVVMAPPNRHLVVRNGRLAFTNDAERNSCRPSIDVLFESLARESGKRTVACLLTGMGRDGAQGLLRIRQAGGMTLAQDEKTSVVYGMPAEAARLGAVERILPIDGIGTALAALAEKRS